MKKILSSLFASALCLGAALPAFAGSNPVGGASGSTVNSGARLVFLFSTPSGRDLYSVTIDAATADRLTASLPAFRSGAFGRDLQFVSNLLFPTVSSASGENTITIRINNLGNAIAAFNRAVNRPGFLSGLSESQIAQLQEMADLLKRFRERVDEE